MIRTLPGILVAICAGIAVGWSMMILVGCGGPQTHQSVELGAYATDDGICVTEATDVDSGLVCIDHYKLMYSPFWPDSGMTVCPVTAMDGGK